MADYQAALELYRKNYLDYKLTGNAAYKTAYVNAQSWLDTYLTNLGNSVTKNANSIDKFVKDYAQANPDIMNMKARMETIRQEGPRLQDMYETEQQATEVEPVDNTSYYVKGAIIAGLAVLALALRR